MAAIVLSLQSEVIHELPGTGHVHIAVLINSNPSILVCY
jgi:hypothetical protein